MQVPVASRSLKAQHRIRAGDLRSSPPEQPVPAHALGSSEAIVNKYLRVNKGVGDVFAAEDLSETPVFNYAGPPLISLSLPPSRALNGLLDPGMLIDVYATVKTVDRTASTRLLWDLKFEAVIDGTSADAPCILILSLPAGQTDAVARLADLCGASDLFIVARAGRGP